MNEDNTVTLPIGFEGKPNEITILTIHGETTFYTCENSDQIRKILSELIPSPNNPSQISTSGQLAELKNMYDNKLITAEEYRAKRRQILGL